LSKFALAQESIYPDRAFAAPVFPAFAAMVTTLEVPPINYEHLPPPFFVFAQRAFAACDAIRLRSAGVIFFILAFADLRPKLEK
jgi:hypothetical protein